MKFQHVAVSNTVSLNLPYVARILHGVYPFSTPTNFRLCDTLCQSTISINFKSNSLVITLSQKKAYSKVKINLNIAIASIAVNL